MHTGLDSIVLFLYLRRWASINEMPATDGVFVLIKMSVKIFYNRLRMIRVLIIKVTISSLAIGLKMSYFPLACQVVIGQFVIGQFNKPITFKDGKL